VVLALATMIVLTPLGLLASGTAFGEDAPPRRALLSGYDYAHDTHPSLGYVLSALVGVVAIALVVGASSALVRVVRRPS
jgi:cobalt/nickel transport system permease protein